LDFLQLLFVAPVWIRSGTILAMHDDTENVSPEVNPLSILSGGKNEESMARRLLGYLFAPSISAGFCPEAE
jgi:hypothetical protein